MANSIKKICILIAPAGNKPSRMMLPYGALYLEAYLRKFGYITSIIDVDIYRYRNRKVIDLISKENPFLIGISGIVTTTYDYVVKIAKLLKSEFPGKKIILGSHISSASEIILRNAPIDFVVHGEGEITFHDLCEKIFSCENDFSEICGIAYIDKFGRYILTPRREQITDLDILVYPNIGMLDHYKYLLPVERYQHYFFHDQRVKDYLRQNPNVNRRVLPLSFSRGCTYACTFCYRHMKGYRKFSAKYAVDWLEKIKEEYGYTFFNFVDENFNIDRTWVYSFINELKKRRIMIFFSVVYAVVKNIEESLLEQLREVGCCSIFYGLDSGSPRILRIMGKHATVKENINVVRLTHKIGLKTAAQIVIGMPGETIETVNETIDFLKQIDCQRDELSIRYALALHGTPLYEYDILTGRIIDEHAYLSGISRRRLPEYASSFALNHTDMNDNELSKIKENIFNNITEKNSDAKWLLTLKSFMLYLKYG